MSHHPCGRKREVAPHYTSHCPYKATWLCLDPSVQIYIAPDVNHSPIWLSKHYRDDRGLSPDALSVCEDEFHVSDDKEPYNWKTPNMNRIFFLTKQREEAEHLIQKVLVGISQKQPTLSVQRHNSSIQMLDPNTWLNFTAKWKTF